ncbi:hypothetical protein B566_EDAN005411 [Ephemera danica]|nr:hypothetical protein B566_EDAN005411 [Ephemera danica]
MDEEGTVHLVPATRSKRPVPAALDLLPHNSNSVLPALRPNTLDLSNGTIVSLRTSALQQKYQEKRSHSSISRTLDVGFTDLSYSVTVGIKRESKAILRGVSGLFPAGELTAIMGASGAGKSSLMNVLAGYTTGGQGGSITVNGMPRDPASFRRHSCYIMQQDCLQPLLTVGEAMHVAAELKLGSNLPHEDKQAWVQEILEALGLMESRKTLTGDLSGGQRKRLAIALELVNNPPVMFFDEPTSGLDSSSSKQCMSLLKSLARGGRTIIVSIHQPSAMLFDSLDQLYVLAEGRCGRCVYRGEPRQMLHFFAQSVNLACPPYHNPADFVLEVSMGDYGAYNDKLVDACENGKCNDWVRHSTAPTPGGFRPAHLTNGLATPVRAPLLPTGPLARTLATLSNGGPEPLSTKEETHLSTSYPASFWTQFYVLLKRNFWRLRRDKFLMQMRLSMHLLVGLLIGILYFRIGDSAANVFDNFGLLFYCVVFLMFTSLLSMIVTFPLELPIIAREHFNRWYSLKSYYLAVTIADIPIQMLCSLGYGTFVYLLSEQPFEVKRYAMFASMCLLVSLVAQTMGLLVGATGMSVESGVFFGPLTNLPFVVFSGFFVHMKDSPDWLHWLFHSSYMKYALEGMMMAVYGFNRPKLSCDEDYCHFKQPRTFLEALGMDKGNFWIDFGFLFALLLILRVLTFLVLKWRIRHIRN